MSNCYFAADEKDLKEFAEFVRSISGIICQSDQRLIAPDEPLTSQWLVFPKGCVPELHERGFVSFDSPCIEINPPWNGLNKNIQPGYFCVRRMDSSTKRLDGELRRYIRKHYHLCYRSIFYLGPSMYENWKKRQETWDYFVDAQYIRTTLDSSEQLALFCFLKGHGYQIEQAEQNAAAAQERSPNAEDFLIFSSGARRSSRVWDSCKGYCVSSYRVSSEGVFLYIRKRKHYNCEFVSDQRNFSDESSVPALFSLIQKYLTDHTEK